MIVDRFGNPYKAAQSAQTYSNSRPWQPVQMKDISTLVPSYDRKTLVSASRRLYLNEGVLVGAIQQKAMYAVGRSWQAQSGSANRDFKKQAEDKLNNEWYNNCDIRGGIHNFQIALYQLSCAVDRDGEAFVLLVSNTSDYPGFQMLPCHRIANPNGLSDGLMTEKGKTKGLRLQDGIVYSKSRPMFYAYNDENGDLIEYLPAKDVVHIFDPAWQEQGRGLPAFTHALNDLRDALQSHDWERHAQLMLSSIGLIEYNETGLPDIPDNVNVLSGSSCSQPSGGLAANILFGGQVRHYVSNSGSKLETIKNDRPGDMWESFQNRIYRKALAGVNWPMSMCWLSTGQGTAERADLGRAQRAVEDRQDLLAYAAKRITSFAIAKFIKRGDLPMDNEFYKWTFSTPKKLTVDDGRVSKELIEMFRSGFLNQVDVLGYLGKTASDHLDERIDYLVMQKTKVYMANKELKKLGLHIDDREMVLLNPNEMASLQVAEQTI